MARGDGIGIKRSETGGSSNIAAKLISQAGTYFSKFNKAKMGLPMFTEGVEGEEEQELSLKLSDEELIALKSKWEGQYAKYFGKISGRQKINRMYWLGEHEGFEVVEQKRGQDNIIFESIETILPMISRQTPEPLVLADNSKEGIKVADDVAKMLNYIADREKLKLKIKQIVRNWALCLIGVFKVGWDFIENDVRISVVKPDNLILDPAGFYDGGEFKGRYIGEKKREDAQRLIKRFPKQADKIREIVGRNLGTEISYMEWWTDDYVFWTLGDLVLDKRKNPHWNYGSTEMQMDEYGMQNEINVEGKNHFKVPKKPYSFLWVFNTGSQPHDETSLIEQTRSLQDTINKRSAQIDRNADDTNSGWVFNNQFDNDSANRAVNALRRGGVIIAPTDSIGEAVQRIQAPPLASYVAEDMYDRREQIRNIMGVRGSTAQGIMSERTVRGKIEIKGQDVDRISLIVEHVEQTVDYLFNLLTQIVYVYYDEPHIAALIGTDKATEMIELRNQDIDRELIVSVKEGSMIPQDPLMRRNEAVELGTAGLIDPLTMFENMDYPNPREATERLIMFRINPMGLVQGGQGQVPMEGVSPVMPEPTMADQEIQQMQTLPPIPPPRF